MKYTCLFILSLLLLGCRHAKNNTNNEPIYKIGYTDLKIDGKLEDVVTNGTYVLALFEDKTVIVLDENMNRVKALEGNVNSVIGGKIEGLNIYKKDFLLEVKDGVFVFDSNLVRKVEAELRLKKIGVVGVGGSADDSISVYTKGWRFYDVNNYNPTFVTNAERSKRIKECILPYHRVYEDSLYYVYMCGFGEFGGSTFFVNKNTRNMYSKPSYFGELFRLNNIYYLIEDYSGMTEYVKIYSPELLYPYQLPMPIEKGVCCNCDSAYKQYFYDFKEPQRKAWNKEHKVDEYYFNRRGTALKSFVKGNRLYSLCSDDTTFYIADVTDSFKVAQVFAKMDKRIGIYAKDKRGLTVGKNTILALDDTYWQIDQENDREEQITQVGFILMKGDSIKIYEHYSTKTYKFSERNK